MVNCQVCGGENFENHLGFYYCSTCHEQSQDYHEQIFDYDGYGGNDNIRVQKRTKGAKRKKKEDKMYDDGIWTSWEAFNYILYGMTQELKKINVPSEFEETVLKMWAAYLKECEAAFTSKFKEGMPKLGYFYKHRDGRILYNVNNSVIPRKRRSSLSLKSCAESKSSLSTLSRRHISMKKKTFLMSEYEEHLSASMLSSSHLTNDTLESLGRSSEIQCVKKSSEAIESVQNFKEILSRAGYKLYKSTYKSPNMIKLAKQQTKKNVKFASKNKLLSIIHLALLMTGSEIQLGDLLRFIREGHLSYAKVTHFLPMGVKFSRYDLPYIDVVSDVSMPTHLKQRKISSQLGYLLKLDGIPTPNMGLLIERYCKDLNLPDKISHFSKKILGNFVPDIMVPRSKSMLPSYEAWAMGSIIFVLKLLFGLNDKTEMFLSDLAKKVNSDIKNETEKQNLFVFEDWQRFIECRKTVLIEHHYPTEEQLCPHEFQSSKKFLDMLLRENKDDYRSERFIPYQKYYMDDKLMTDIREMLNSLLKPQCLETIDFPPSLTPQTKHIEIILKNVASKDMKIEEDGGVQNVNLPEKILRQNFQKDDIEFAFNPEKYIEILGDGATDLLKRFSIDPDSGPSQDDSFQRNGKFSKELILNSSSNYWILSYHNSSSGYLANFKEEIFERTPKNFQWLMYECARMIEMNVRDVYDELLQLENKIILY